MSGIVIGEADVKVGVDTSGTAAAIKADVAKSLAPTEAMAADAGDKSGKSFGSKFGSWLVPGKKSLITTGIVTSLAALPGVAGIAGLGVGTALIGGIAGVVIKGAMSSVMPLVTAYGALQSAAPGKAQTAALAAYNAQLQQMSPAQRALAGSIEQVQSAWKNFISANVGSVATLMSGGFGLIPGLLKGMGQVFQSIVPQMSAVWKSLGGVLNGVIGIAKTAAPAFGPFISALLTLISNIFPGLQLIIYATLPLLTEISQIFGQVGTDLGNLFKVMAPAVGASMPIFQALMGLIGGLLPVIGQLAASLAGSLGPVLASFAGAVQALSPSLIIVGQVLGSLAGAILSSLAGALTAIAQLLKAVAPSFALLATTLSLVFTALENAGVFGILEDALESLAAPLGNLINALLHALLPMLPPLISLFIQLAAILTEMLAAGLTVLINAAAKLITFLGPMVPILVAIIGAVRLWAVVQGLLDIALMANPIGLIIIAIAALIGVVIEIVKHWNDILTVAKTVWNAVLAFIKAWWPILLGFLLGPFGLLVGLFIKFHAQIIAGVKAAWNAVFAFIKAVFGNIVSEVSLGWTTAKNLVISAGSAIVSTVKSAWNTAKSAVSSAIGGIISLVGSLPGKIISALGNVGSLLYNSGVKIVQGLINGITGMIGSAANAIGGLVSTLKSYLPFSPAKQGPFSGPGDPSNSGVSIARKIASGLTGGTSLVTAAMKALTSKVSAAASFALPSAGMSGIGSVPPLGAANSADYSSAVQNGAYQGVLAAMQQGGNGPRSSIVINASTASASSAAGIAQSLRSLSELGIV